ncbi:MAG: hypothetical protein V8Q57_01500 [Blautia sp.]
MLFDQSLPIGVNKDFVGFVIIDAAVMFLKGFDELLEEVVDTFIARNVVSICASFGFQDRPSGIHQSMTAGLHSSEIKGVVGDGLLFNLSVVVHRDRFFLFDLVVKMNDRVMGNEIG